MRTVEMLENRMKMLKKALKKAGRESGQFPDGHIRLSSCRGKMRYYHIRPGQVGDGTYIPQGNEGLIKQLAQKEYNVRFLRTAGDELAILKNTAKKLRASSADFAYEGMRQGLKPFVKPYFEPDEQYVGNWQATKYKECSYRPEARIYKTEKGEMVRSKSEALIASILWNLGVPYHYEKPLRLAGGKTRYPDFTLLHVGERKVYYLEHFGRMDDPDYIRGFYKKIHEYSGNGIYLGVNLLATFESLEKPLDMDATKTMLRAIFK